VQPVSGVGLVSLALFSHFYLQVSRHRASLSRSPLCMVPRQSLWDHPTTLAPSRPPQVPSMSTPALQAQESLQPSEWLAVALAAAGTIGLGATTEEAPKGSAVSVVRAVAVVSVLVVALGKALLSACICTTRRAYAPGQ
jgi:hypothetical protein